MNKREQARIDALKLVDELVTAGQRRLADKLALVVDGEAVAEAIANEEKSASSVNNYITANRIMLECVHDAQCVLSDLGQAFTGRRGDMVMIHGVVYAPESAVKVTYVITNAVRDIEADKAAAKRLVDAVYQ